MLAVAAVVLAVAAAWALAHTSNHQPSAPVADESTAAPSAVSTAPPRILSVREQLLSYIYERAHDPTVAEDIVRSDGSTQQCPLVPSGTAPQKRLRDYVQQTLPRMQVLDVARIIDKFSGLCALELRSRDDTGTVLVVRVIPPVEQIGVVDPRVDDGSAITNGAFTRFVRVSSRDGWVVTAGLSGPADSGPSLSVLLTLAQQRALLW